MVGSAQDVLSSPTQGGQAPWSRTACWATCSWRTRSTPPGGAAPPGGHTDTRWCGPSGWRRAHLVLGPPPGPAPSLLDGSLLPHARSCSLTQDPRRRS